jgi:hypothetical protein
VVLVSKLAFTFNVYRYVEVAYASRTDCPEWAYEALKLMRVCRGVTLADAAAYAEIYPGGFCTLESS